MFYYHIISVYLGVDTKYFCFVVKLTQGHTWWDSVLGCLTPTGTDGLIQPHWVFFSQIARGQGVLSRRTFQYPLVDQFYTYPEKLMNLTQ